ncbi:MAG: hypothetical protein QM740_04440 [Acidovorax sp.]
MASRLSDDAPWNTFGNPSFAGASGGPLRGADGTFHHFIALFTTVAGKACRAPGFAPDFCNEINDLERFLTLILHTGNIIKILFEQALTGFYASDG